MCWQIESLSKMKTVVIEVTSTYIEEVDDDFDVNDPEWYESVDTRNPLDIEALIYFVPNGTDDIYDKAVGDAKYIRELEVDIARLEDLIAYSRKRNPDLAKADEYMERSLNDTRRRLADARAKSSKNSETT